MFATQPLDDWESPLTYTELIHYVRTLSSIFFMASIGTMNMVPGEFPRNVARADQQYEYAHKNCGVWSVLFVRENRYFFASCSRQDWVPGFKESVQYRLRTRKRLHSEGNLAPLFLHRLANWHELGASEDMAKEQRGIHLTAEFAQVSIGTVVSEA